MIGHTQMLQAMGAKVRKQRRRLGYTLDELAQKSGISKPYLSLIETGRVINPASDEKLRRLENVLQFRPGELVSQADLCRTPKDIRAVLISLMKEGDGPGRGPEAGGQSSEVAGPRPGKNGKNGHAARPGAAAGDPAPAAGQADPAGHPEETSAGNGASVSQRLKSLAALGLTGGASATKPLNPSSGPRSLLRNGIDLDDAYLNGVLHKLVEQSAGNVERVSSNSVPVINKVSAGYPRDFTDLSYPPRVADEYVGCPEVQDKDAFAARVHGDSMKPKYQEGDIVIFSPSASLRNGDDCFVRLEDGHTTFKRVFFEKDDAGAEVIRLQPRNEKYRAQSLPREQVTGIYRALYRYQRLDTD